MRLINEKVFHNSFGEGQVTVQDKKRITVIFQNKKAEFIFPDAFDGYLTLLNKELGKQVQKEIIAKKIAKEKARELKRRRIEEEREQKANKSRSGRKRKRAVKRSNVAFKCNFCDGGRTKEQVGYEGICSNDQIQYNIKKQKHVWCMEETNQCAKFLSGDLSRRQLDAIYEEGSFVCYESAMLRDWKAYAGIYRSGKKAGQPMKLKQVQENSLTILTTRSPNAPEKERFIFAVFLVGEGHSGDHNEEGFVAADSKYKIKFSPKEAEDLLFWNYHANQSSPEIPRWSSGLHRYLDDKKAVQILQDVVKVKKGTADETLAKEFLNHFILINGIDLQTVPAKKGALKLDKS